MGKKISVDSSTLMNKGLEIIQSEKIFNYSSEALEQSLLRKLLKVKIK